MSKNISKLIKSDNGVALILVLCIVTVLVTTGFALSQSARLNMKLSGGYGKYQKAYYISLAGIETAKAEIFADTSTTLTLTSKLFSNDNQFKEVNISDGSYSLAYTTFSDIKKRRYGVIDEERKLDINSVTKEILKKIPGLPDDVINSIVKEVKKTEELKKKITTGDTESIKAFYTIEQLLDIKGLAPGYFYGEDFNRNGLLDINENDGGKNFPPDNADNKLKRGLKDYFTTFSDGRININTAPEEIIALLPGVNSELAQKIVYYRDIEKNTFSDNAGLLKVNGITGDVLDKFSSFIKFSSGYFRITSIGTLNKKQIKSRVVSIVKKNNKSLETVYRSE